eukprot:scaffold249589_cov18-Tisochrysis_lutea.AAC.2
MASCEVPCCLMHIVQLDLNSFEHAIQRHPGLILMLASCGLANLLWSLAKMADPSHETMMAIVIRQVESEDH